jgi:hypothetical protein
MAKFCKWKANTVLHNYVVPSAITFANATTVGQSVDISIGTSTLKMIYANNQSSIVFPTGSDNSGVETLTTKFFIADSDITYYQAQIILQWAYDNGKFSTTVSDHNGVSSTTIKWGQQELFDLNGGSSGYEMHLLYNTGVFSVTEGYENYPVCYVSWYGAVMLCQWLTEMKDGNTNNLAYSGIDTTWNSDETIENFTNTGYRLPKLYTEAWYAMRYLGTSIPTTSPLSSEYISQGNNGGSASLTTGYYWTPGTYASGATDGIDNESETAEVAVFYAANPTSVKTKRANQLSIYDLSGNYWKWCENYEGSGSRNFGSCWDREDMIYLQVYNESSNATNQGTYDMCVRMVKTQ